MLLLLAKTSAALGFGSMRSAYDYISIYYILSTNLHMSISCINVRECVECLLSIVDMNALHIMQCYQRNQTQHTIFFFLQNS